MEDLEYREAMEFAFLSMVVRADISKVTFEQRIEGYVNGGTWTSEKRVFHTEKKPCAKALRYAQFTQERARRPARLKQKE